MASVLVLFNKSVCRQEGQGRNPSPRPSTIQGCSCGVGGGGRRAFRGRASRTRREPAGADEQGDAEFGARGAEPVTLARLAPPPTPQRLQKDGKVLQVSDSQNYCILNVYRKKGNTLQSFDPYPRKHTEATKVAERNAKQRINPHEPSYENYADATASART
ncbi:hypothetical protein EKL30_10645 [Candidimonas sp. SYP-B2681]|uniref:hypothetical protein n=1 Tax=Candidimonas sp. SYP-B2681 TaxID=2497686 RepID=UPI000F894882|nr:hypothetical protein [Candidimonas sp. SYP-B2681]RTZ43323.1 hypothetical protein EKL30_10645 [Candidimonas sp. SYP-B2681]